jgi:hypothetical protein
MEYRSSMMRFRMRRQTRVDVARAILLVGLTSALAVFLTARNPAPDPLGNPLETSKLYRRNLELYGGDANVLASELLEEFAGLWRGKPLAFTLAVLTLAAAGGFLLLTRNQAAPASGSRGTPGG